MKKPTERAPWAFLCARVSSVRVGGGLEALDVASKTVGRRVESFDLGAGDHLRGGVEVGLGVEPAGAAVDVEEAGEAVVGEEEAPAQGGDLGAELGGAREEADDGLGVGEVGGEDA